jgi:hypothetical protein
MTTVATGIGKKTINSQFYDFQRSGQQIEKLKKFLITNEAKFEYGFQPYNQKSIVSTTCFYNQPSNVMHYVLTNSKKHTLHFQIPLLDLQSINISPIIKDDKQIVELVYKDQKGMRVKEHSADGTIIFSLRFTTYQIPIPKDVNAENFTKVFNKIIKKANSFQE